MARPLKIVKISCIAEQFYKNMTVYIPVSSIVTSMCPLLLILLKIIPVIDSWSLGSYAKEAYINSCNQVFGLP